MTFTAAPVGPQAYIVKYPRREESVPRMRRDVRAAIYTWRLDAILEEAELVACELYTNAIRHGLGSPRIEVRRMDSGVEIRVSDASKCLPCLRDPADEEKSGRGLRIVDTLSASWGVTHTRGGKCVWAHVCG